MHRIINNSCLAGLYVLAFFIAMNSQAQSFLTNGLVAYYPFNGNANDDVGTNNGTVYGAVLTNDRFGNGNSAFNFSGADGVFIQTTGNPTFALSNVTFSVWLNSANLAGTPSSVQSDIIISTIAPTTSYGGVQLFNYRYDRKLILEYRTSGGLNYQLSSTNGSFGTNSYNKWVNIVSSLSATSGVVEAKIYVNGEQTYLTNFVGQPPSYNGQPCFVGANCDWAGSQREFAGRIDDVRIYNRALSSSEVAQLYGLESGQPLSLIKAVALQTYSLNVGSNYQIQASSDLINWTNQGPVFTATSAFWQSTSYWPVANWNQLFFRVVQQ